VVLGYGGQGKSGPKIASNSKFQDIRYKIFYATFLEKVAQKSPATQNFRTFAIKASKI
jgi:hypothetical protein